MSSNTPNNKLKKRLQEQKEIDTLNREMEIAVYSTNRYGRARRRAHRSDAVVRTMKRKRLEEEDAAAIAETVDHGSKKVRGSLMALKLKDNLHDDDDDDEDINLAEHNEDTIEEVGVSESEIGEGSDCDGDYQEASEIEVESDSDVDSENGEASKQDNISSTKKGRTGRPKKNADKNETLSEEIERYKEKLISGGKRVKRKMYRLKNFTSRKLADQHGEALGAYALGKQKVAVEKLGEVAVRSPAAPQVYSTLGLFYESLLNNSESVTTESADDKTNKDPMETIATKLDIGRKAYGSYHVAALLCKKDYTLWVRAGDGAIHMSDLHTTAMRLCRTTPPYSNNRDSMNSLIEQHRGEKLKWLKNAKDDYQTADNIRPPGITVPAKLAHTHLILGNLGEALTIMEDLRSSNMKTKEVDSEGSELDRSYTCWVLYADLMLRVGHECSLWNKRVSQNDNYMFKRWLRKYSMTFDWQERRLLGLFKALEAACGTEACGKVGKWMRARIKSQKEAAKEADVADRTEESEETFAKNGNKDSEENGEKTQNSNSPKEPNVVLRISAAMSPACDIASQLMKLCIMMDLFDAAALVGEGLSLYIKARYNRRERRKSAELSYVDGNAKRQAETFTIMEKHDEVFDESTSSDEDDEIVLEDDDEFDSITDESMLKSLSKGILPPEIQSLYASALIGKGGKDFIAWKILQTTVPQLEIEDLSVEEMELLDLTGVVSDPGNEWMKFQRNTVSPLRRTRMILFISDLLCKLEKNKEWNWISRLTLLLRSHLNYLDESHRLSALRSVNINESSVVAFARNDHVKLILSLAKIQLYEAEYIRQSDELQTQEYKAKPAKLALNVIELMVRFRGVFWKGQKENSTIHDSSLQLLKLLSGAFRIVIESKASGSSSEKDYLKKESISDLLAKLRHFVSLIVKVNISLDTSLKKSQSSDDFMKDLRAEEFPIPHKWQNSVQRAISLRTYNLCVGCNISAFSGWERDEFTLSHVVIRSSVSYFGIKVRGNYVSGYLTDNEAEGELSDQWKHVYALCPGIMPEVDFDSSLVMAKKEEWYSTAMEKLKYFTDTVANNGEDYALNLLLYFSRLCLHIAINDDECENKEELIKLSLSVILPVTQYCLDQQMWNSDIGTSAATKDGPVVWGEIINSRMNFVDHNNNAAGREYDSGKNSIHIQKSRPAGSKLLKGHQHNPQPFMQIISAPVPKPIAVPVKILLEKWKAYTPQEEKLNKNNANGKLHMNRVDQSIRQLRSCFTLQSLQKASIRVAVCLLDLAGQPDCHNPFLCIHQAAMFAGQGSKGGNNDTHFKRIIPPKKTCTELEALLILGRADCMRALALVDQAMFLVSYIAEVCSFQRKKRKITKPNSWESRWLAVSIHMYTVSVAIDRTIFNLSHEGDEKKLEWEEHIKEEIDNGKADANSVLESFQKKNDGLDTLDEYSDTEQDIYNNMSDTETRLDVRRSTKSSREDRSISKESDSESDTEIDFMRNSSSIGRTNLFSRPSISDNNITAGSKESGFDRDSQKHSSRTKLVHNPGLDTRKNMSISNKSDSESEVEMDNTKKQSDNNVDKSTKEFDPFSGSGFDFTSNKSSSTTRSNSTGKSKSSEMNSSSTAQKRTKKKSTKKKPITNLNGFEEDDDLMYSDPMSI